VAIRNQLNTTQTANGSATRSLLKQGPGWLNELGSCRARVAQ